MAKIKRNDLCPCGSGKKYKKCCWLKEVPPPSPETIKEVTEIFQRKMQERKKEELILQEKGIFINYIHPCSYVNPKTNQKVKAWALGNQLFHTRPEHETFHDFIVGHLLKDVMGKEWWDGQLQAQKKHFLFQCFLNWEEWRKKSFTEKNKIDENTCYAIADGWVKTLLSLAFDICSLEHTQQLPDHLLRRLKNHGEYQGAHYEIAVAAMFSRLGCKIDFLDKEQVTTPHCEFIATHNDTGVEISVEAKSRQRPGIKHMEGKENKYKQLRGDVQKLFNKALKQNPKDKPFIVFIDINSPLTPEIPMEKKQWFLDIEKMLNTYPKPTKENPEEYTGIFFTNFSSHYDASNKSLPNEYLAVIPNYAIYPMPNHIFGNILLKAVQNYGFVPNVTEESD